MIVFDLDGTLADCTHRRHYVDPELNTDVILCIDSSTGKKHYIYKDIVLTTNPPQNKKWQPNWDKFHEACDLDIPIKPTIICFNQMVDCWGSDMVQIWSGRMESVREKTCRWLDLHVPFYNKNIVVKMRPVGDYTPDNELKEKWLDEALAEGKTIDFVVDDRKKVVEMWRRRGIFVFDVNQTGKDY